jgi:hypothetical protein
MSSVDDLVAGLNAVVERTEFLREQVIVAGDCLDRAQVIFGGVTYGSRNSYTRESFNALQAARDAASEAYVLLAGVGTYLGIYIGHITASDPDGRLAASWSVALSRGLNEREWRLGHDPAIDRFRPGETQTGRLVEEARRVVLVRSPKKKGPDWVGPDGRTYDAIGNFPAEFFDREWPQVQDKILDHMEKADLVPVDVSRFTSEQIARVREFIGPLGPRVFIVGV